MRRWCIRILLVAVLFLFLPTCTMNTARKADDCQSYISALEALEIEKKNSAATGLEPAISAVLEKSSIRRPTKETVRAFAAMLNFSLIYNYEWESLAKTDHVSGRIFRVQPTTGFYDGIDMPCRGFAITIEAGESITKGYGKACRYKNEWIVKDIIVETSTRNKPAPSAGLLFYPQKARVKRAFCELMCKR